MKRAKLGGLKRNACIAAGNRGDRRYVGALAEILDTSDEIGRSHAAWALGEIGGPEARRRLKRALAREQDAAVIEEIEAALRALARSAPEA